MNLRVPKKKVLLKDLQNLTIFEIKTFLMNKMISSIYKYKRANHILEILEQKFTIK